MDKSVFRVGVTRDFLGPDGTSDLDDFAGPLFDGAGLQWELLLRIHRYYKPHRCKITMHS